MPTSPCPFRCGLLLALAALAAFLVTAGPATARPSGADATARAPHRGEVARSRPAGRPSRAAARVRRAVIGDRNPFDVLPLWVAPDSPAAEQARAWRGSRPADAALMAEIAHQPQALWLGDWVGDVRAAAASAVAAARADDAIPLLVAYNIPDRDCGQHSGGGATSSEGYAAWVDDLARGIGAGPAAIVLEPDGLAALDCMTPEGRRDRLDQLSGAVTRLAAQANTAVYIDAGNPTWIGAAEMARRLRAAGVARARGFAVNVSSFSTTAESRAYGRAVSRRLGGAPFVIDTGRNGAGRAPGDEWCNPAGRALGERPTAATGDRAVDALLWVKRPGESDGTCSGGPPAGAWWPDYALGLARGTAGL